MLEQPATTSLPIVFILVQSLGVSISLIIVITLCACCQCKKKQKRRRGSLSSVDTPYDTTINVHSVKYSKHAQQDKPEINLNSVIVQATNRLDNQRNAASQSDVFVNPYVSDNYVQVDKDLVDHCSQRSTNITKTTTQKHEEWISTETYLAQRGTSNADLHSIEVTDHLPSDERGQPLYEPIDDTDSERDPLYSRVMPRQGISSLTSLRQQQARVHLPPRDRTNPYEYPIFNKSSDAGPSTSTLHPVRHHNSMKTGGTMGQTLNPMATNNGYSIINKNKEQTPPRLNQTCMSQSQGHIIYSDTDESLYSGSIVINSQNQDVSSAHRREPSYRYITVRESLNVLRQRMTEQGRLADRQQAEADGGSAHYYSTIGSDTGYEGVSTPLQHLYEDINNLQVGQRDSARESHQQQSIDADGYVYIRGTSAERALDQRTFDQHIRKHEAFLRQTDPVAGPTRHYINGKLWSPGEANNTAPGQANNTAPTEQPTFIDAKRQSLQNSHDDTQGNERQSLIYESKTPTNGNEQSRVRMADRVNENTIQLLTESLSSDEEPNRNELVDNAAMTHKSTNINTNQHSDSDTTQFRRDNSRSEINDKPSSDQFDEQGSQRINSNYNEALQTMNPTSSVDSQPINNNSVASMSEVNDYNLSKSAENNEQNDRRNIASLYINDDISSMSNENTDARPKGVRIVKPNKGEAFDVPIENVKKNIIDRSQWQGKPIVVGPHKVHDQDMSQKEVSKSAEKMTGDRAPEMSTGGKAPEMTAGKNFEKKCEDNAPVRTSSIRNLKQTDDNVPEMTTADKIFTKQPCGNAHEMNTGEKTFEKKADDNAPGITTADKILKKQTDDNAPEMTTDDKPFETKADDNAREMTSGDKIFEKKTDPNLPENTTGDKIFQTKTHPNLPENTLGDHIFETKTDANVPENTTVDKIIEPKTHQNVPENTTSGKIVETKIGANTPEKTTPTKAPVRTPQTRDVFSKTDSGLGTRKVTSKSPAHSRPSSRLQNPEPTWGSTHNVRSRTDSGLTRANSKESFDNRKPVANLPRMSPSRARGTELNDRHFARNEELLSVDTVTNEARLTPDTSSRLKSTSTARSLFGTDVHSSKRSTPEKANAALPPFYGGVGGGDNSANTSPYASPERHSQLTKSARQRSLTPVERGRLPITTDSTYGPKEWQEGPYTIRPANLPTEISKRTFLRDQLNGRQESIPSHTEASFTTAALSTSADEVVRALKVTRPDDSGINKCGNDGNGAPCFCHYSGDTVNLQSVYTNNVDMIEKAKLLYDPMIC